MSTHEENPLVSIGLPVYNSEKFLRTRLDSILSQTFQNFELIISDDASTDSSHIICQECIKKDKRIRYVRQEKNMGGTWNFNFTLQQAKGKYFMWAGADDFILPTFIEKNLAALESNKNVVCSMSKIKHHGLENYNDFESNQIDLFFKNFIKKIRNSLKPVGIVAVFGSYKDKVRFFLKNSSNDSIYGLFRTEQLRNSMVRSIVSDDLAILLNILKYGDIHVVNEVLLSKFDGGVSKKGMIGYAKKYNQSLSGIVFPAYPVTKWCFKNLGKKIFLQNLDYFILLNIWVEFTVFLDFLRISIHSIKK
jgi:glycosyltransferase involved in cell wall biosynthesis